MIVVFECVHWGGILFLKSTTVHVSENGNRPMVIGTILSFYICTNFYVAGELYSYYIYIYILYTQMSI